MCATNENVFATLGRGRNVCAAVIIYIKRIGEFDAVLYFLLFSFLYLENIVFTLKLCAPRVWLRKGTFVVSRTKEVLYLSNFQRDVEHTFARFR